MSKQKECNLGDDLPRLGPAYTMLIHEQPHQLWHSYGRVSVVQLEGHLLWESI